MFEDSQRWAATDRVEVQFVTLRSHVVFGALISTTEWHSKFFVHILSHNF